MEADLESELAALAKAIDATWQRTRSNEFAEMVHQYRQVEEEFVRRAGNDDAIVLETKRRIAETLLRQATVTNQAFDVCHGIWSELNRLGFTNMQVACTMSWFYAESCLRNGRADAGITVLVPLIDELVRLHRESSADSELAEYYEYEIERLEKLRARLDAATK